MAWWTGDGDVRKKRTERGDGIRFHQQEDGGESFHVGVGTSVEIPLDRLHSFRAAESIEERGQLLFVFLAQIRPHGIRFVEET